MKKGVWGHQAPIGYLNVRDESYHNRPQERAAN